MACYRYFGSELITLDSGAHRAEKIIADFNFAMDMLLELGYRYFTFYKEH